MQVFEKIKVTIDRHSYRITGLHYGGLFIFATFASLLTFVPAVYSWLFYPIGFVSVEMLLAVVLTLLTSIYGFGFIVVITRDELRFYETYCFIPFLKIKEPLNNIFIDGNGPPNAEVIIEWQDDPWAEMGFSDWVAIRKGTDEYHFGTNKNHRELLRKISEGIKMMKSA